MAIVVVLTDDGREAWRYGPVDDHDASAIPSVPSQSVTHSMLRGMARAITDANAIQAGRNPERPSERAMRLAEAADWNSGVDDRHDAEYERGVEAAEQALRDRER